MWDAMNDVDDLTVPPDLADALTRLQGAQVAYDSFPPSTRRNILRWIASAKRSETRARRITRIAQDASRGIRTKTNG
jgi:uncharacterized protein YdeI (YjbR/CyaY-like superfamily)